MRCSLTAVTIVWVVLAVVYLAQYVRSLPSGGVSIDDVRIVVLKFSGVVYSFLIRTDR